MIHLLRKIGEVGIINCILGGVKRERYKRLCKKYHFDSWHITPYELRKYLQDTVAYVNEKKADVVVDIGCGLGEMLRHINARKRVGFDIHEEPNRVARMLHKGNVIYHVGSFDEVNLEETIEYLITLNFMHGSTEETWRDCYHDIAKRNDIRHILIDTVPEGYNGAHYLNFSMILPDNYKLIDKMGPFLGGRFIEVYEKKVESKLKGDLGLLQNLSVKTLVLCYYINSRNEVIVKNV